MGSRLKIKQAKLLKKVVNVWLLWGGLLFICLPACTSVVMETSPTSQPPLSPIETTKPHTPVSIIPSSTPTVAAMSTPTIGADITINPYQGEEHIIAKVGQKIAVLSPEPNMEWHVDYHPSYLQAIEPPKNGGAFDESNWLFQAINPGQSELRLTGKATCPKGQLCPPASIEFLFSIDILEG